MYIQYENGRIAFKDQRHTFLLTKELWEKLKEIYGSVFSLEFKRNGSFQAYIRNSGSNEDDCVELASDENGYNSDEENAPTSRENAFPFRADYDPADADVIGFQLKRQTTVSCNVAGTLKKILNNRLGNESLLKQDNVVPAVILQGKKVDLMVKEIPENQRDNDCYTESSLEVVVNRIAPAVGFKNYGSTCYVNATMQCLLSISELNSYFLDERYKKIQYETQMPKFKVTYMISCLYHEYFQEPRPSYIAPKTFVKMCPTGQQDAHEFLWKKLAPFVQEEANPKVKEELPEEADSKTAWEIYRKNNKSIFEKIFAGQYERKVCCKKCGNVSTTYDPFLDISLPIAKISIENCLRLHFKEEELTEKESYNCEKCGATVAATKALRIEKPPRYLLLHLKRLINGTKKISTFIKYQSYLDLTEFCAEKEQDVMYTLLGVCVHNGGPQGGHYYALGKRGNKVIYIVL